MKRTLALTGVLAAATLASAPLTAGVASAAPAAHSSKPVIHGVAAVGHTVSCASSARGAATYRWTVAGKAVAKATHATYRPTAAAAGKPLRCAVAPARSAHVAFAAAETSDPVTVVQGPSNLTPPVISGAGHTLSCTAGTWSNDPDTLTYEWTRNGSPVPDAASPTLTVDDTLAVYQCLVSAGNAAGATGFVGSDVLAYPLASGATTAPGAPGAGATPVAGPVNDTAPVLSVDAHGLLSCSQGTWDNDPTAYSYEWTSNGSPVPHADGSTLASSGDQATYQCLVAASNAAGGTGYVASSALTYPSATPGGTDVQGPANHTAPVLTVARGGVLTCAPGTWDNYPDTLLYEWTRDGSPVEHADGATLSPGEAGAGHTFVCLVSGRNTAGQTGYVASNGVDYLGPHAYAPTLSLTTSPYYGSYGIALAGDGYAANTLHRIVLKTSGGIVPWTSLTSDGAGHLSDALLAIGSCGITVSDGYAFEVLSPADGSVLSSAPVTTPAC